MRRPHFRFGLLSEILDGGGHARHNKLRSALTILGMVIGVTSSSG